MKKVIKLEDLDCANCAAQLENKIGKLDGVITASVDFMGQKMELEAADDAFDGILAQAKDIIKKFDPDIVVHA